MSESNYEEYKKNLSRSQKKQNDLHSGKICLLVGAALLVYGLYILPFNAAKVRDLRGDELKGWKAYYVENLQLLHIGVDEDNNRIYCIAEFYDGDLSPWVILFSPGTDKHLEEQIKFAAAYGRESDLTISGYVYLEDVPGRANSYFSAYSSRYVASGEARQVDLFAAYLCGASGNFTMKALLRPSRTLASLVWGLSGVIYGGIMLFKHRTRKAA